jgi:hypothetical protein
MQLRPPQDWRCERLRLGPIVHCGAGLRPGAYEGTHGRRRAGSCSNPKPQGPTAACAGVF